MAKRGYWVVVRHGPQGRTTEYLSWFSISGSRWYSEDLDKAIKFVGREDASSAGYRCDDYRDDPDECDVVSFIETGEAA